MNKFVKVAAATGVALSLGLTTIAPTTSLAAEQIGNITYQDSYKTIQQFTKADLAKLTGVEVTTANVNAVYNQLKVNKTWTKAGFKAAEAKQIAASATAYTQQLKGILTDIAKNSNKGLHLAYITTPYTTQVNFGTFGSGSSGSTGTDTPAVTPAALSVTKIEVQIEYKKQDVEFQYEVKSNGTVKAKFENEFTKEKLEGAAAQAKIEAIFANFDIQKKSQTQIVNQVLTKLNLGKDYKEFEFEAKFSNNSKLEFEI
ncbi:YusW family protein [Listeria booriae]|uniref:Uncharacterized protein n=1 Tax=Listeria booriae TaxID=1552123 RepID=A0A842G6U1_9LIST|nr:YusW family protein [Listeria booriae]MBC1291000.1 hypothetical protein [Listeria booriae]MBC1401065.1 hypothetical protein [Listeria booriae]MBC1565272.1 hypothetical protein [Listeria booriae]MBC1617107.1 hypothetical protein [Listeria booriae]MBC1943662.1 hypothetical protein [Listeria booriae]